MPAVLILSPEPPYPLHGGGAFRTASLVHYFAGFADVDLILISETGAPALLPPGLVRKQQVIPLPANSRGAVARYFRNASRAVRGVPPLIDRLSGLSKQIRQCIGAERYDVGVIEHFWCAPYLDCIARCCDVSVLNLHNVESVLHARCADAAPEWAVRAGHRRFAAASRSLEAELLPRFSRILATSENDAALVKGIAPGSRLTVYPNALPSAAVPDEPELPRLVFAGNFEYHPNIDAVRFLVSEIWPEVKRRHPELELWLVGRGEQHIRNLLPPDAAIRTTGAIPDARREIARARLVLAPLRAGSGTRIKILEAWAAARPVVATPLGAEGLDARHGENLLLRDGAEDFIDAIDHLLGDPTTRQRLGAAGRQTFETLYSWEAAAKTLDFFA